MTLLETAKKLAREYQLEQVLDAFAELEKENEILWSQHGQWVEQEKRIVVLLDITAPEDKT